MTALGGRLVFQLRQEDLLAVVGEQLAGEGAFEDFLRDGDDDAARALAVESRVRKDDRVAVGIEQLDTVDELQVRTVDGDLLAALDLVAGLLGEAGNEGLADREQLRGFRLLGGCADDDLAAVCSDACRRIDADHVVADKLEVGDFDTVREFDLRDVLEAGTIDGHRLVGHDFRREEHLDAQSEILRLDDRIEDVTSRERPHHGDGQTDA